MFWTIGWSSPWSCWPHPSRSAAGRWAAPSLTARGGPFRCLEVQVAAEGSPIQGERERRPLDHEVSCHVEARASSQGVSVKCLVRSRDVGSRLVLSVKCRVLWRVILPGRVRPGRFGTVLRHRVREVSGVVLTRHVGSRVVLAGPVQSVKCRVWCRRGLSGGVKSRLVRCHPVTSRP
jgi:hypothetical protein